MWMVTAGLAAIATVWAQQSSPSDPWNFQQLGIASVVCALLFAWGWTNSKKNDRLTIECAQLREDKAEREREIGNTIVPLLTQAIEVLRDVKEDARRMSGESELLQVVRRLEQTTRRLGDAPER